MQQVGFTAVGTVLVEMSIEEWDKIAPESEVVILESPYDDNALAKFLEVIFGERVSIIDVLEKNTDGVFSLRMTMALGNISDRQKLVLELLFGLKGNEPLTLAQVDSKLGAERGTAGRVRDKAIRQLRHPRISRGLRRFATPASEVGKETYG